MYSVIFEDEFHSSLYIFLESYKNVFKRLYSDTGIPEENLLFKTYIESSKKIEEEIIDKIEYYLQEEIVAYKILDGKKSIKFFIKSFMLEVFYEEDMEEKIRFIEGIIINKK
ncbi:MAG: hypothetical protein Q9M94_03575 [Candidatus Gracilibacteria bacterium]|nr:hypothetical protein [Candidatus Gracilibacteria bacterium]MDQ7021941.1 hypothetical protein [Candidatus Gracilibacteria bacterium]